MLDSRVGGHLCRFDWGWHRCRLRLGLELRQPSRQLSLQRLPVLRWRSGGRFLLPVGVVPGLRSVQLQVLHWAGLQRQLLQFVEPVTERPKPRWRLLWARIQGRLSQRCLRFGLRRMGVSMPRGQQFPERDLERLWLPHGQSHWQPRALKQLQRPQSRVMTRVFP